MITGSENKIYVFNEVITAFEKAAKGIVLIDMMEKGSSISNYTGWLITDTLVAAPFFDFDNNSQTTSYSCRFADSQAGEAALSLTIEDILPQSETTERNTQVTLFRLPASYPDRSLKINFKIPEPASAVFVLQYNSGAPTLMISSGQLIFTDAGVLQYNADTLPGSSGSPVLNSLGQVIGVHLLKSFDKATTAPDNNERKTVNSGIPVPAMFEQFKKLKQWKEVAGYHKLVSLVYNRSENLPSPMKETVVPITHPVLVNAALQWHFDPQSETDKKILQPYSIDVPGKWTIKDHERQRILKETGNLSLMRLHWKPVNADDTGTRVVNRILQGPPYPLSAIKDGELPYWLQAVTWFPEEGFQLPSPAAINLELEQRRMKSRLQQVAGKDFLGRIAELKTLKDWHTKKNTGALLVTGMGGIGKSALISKFLLDLPPLSVYFWLDFDRADLSPDDAESVLDIIAGQAVTQFPGFKKPVWEKDQEETNAIQLGKAIKKALGKNKPSPVLVLDGFEVAQHAEAYNEIWGVLENIMKNLPDLKVIVSGRAPVKSLKLLGHETTMLPLKGLDAEFATRWLNEHQITAPAVVKQIILLSRGIPLILRLAAKLAAETGDQLSVPEKLPQSMIEGYLYRRILDRVIDPLLKNLAKEVLIVRKLNVPILQGIFSTSLPEEVETGEVFKRLKFEMSLVNETDTGTSVMLANAADELFLRPEVRSATLRLLEIEDKNMVQSIHQKAINWYNTTDISQPVNTAELIYHHLHLGNTTRADELWNLKCKPFLSGSQDDFDEKSDGYKWILNKVPKTGSSVQTENTEEKIVKSIVNNFARNREKAIPKILAEEKVRDPDGTLQMYDALMMINYGEFEKAAEFLNTLSPQKQIAIEQQRILQAMTARSLGKKNETEKYLRSLEELYTAEEKEGQPWNIFRLLVRSARIRLNVETENELSLLNEATRSSELFPLIHNLLSPADIMLPRLEEIVRSGTTLESIEEPLRIPDNTYRLAGFNESLYERKRRSTRLPYDEVSLFITPEEAEAQWRSRLEEAIHKKNKSNSDTAFHKLILELAVSGFKKWMLASCDLYLYEVSRFVESGDDYSNTIKLAAGATLAAFRSMPLIFSRDGEQNLKDQMTDRYIKLIIEKNSMYSTQISPSEKAQKTALEILHAEYQSKAAREFEMISKKVDWHRGQPLDLIMNIPSPSFSMVLYLLGPDPLQVMCRQLMSLPENYIFKYE